MPQRFQVPLKRTCQHYIIYNLETLIEHKEIIREFHTAFPNQEPIPAVLSCICTNPKGVQEIINKGKFDINIDKFANDEKRVVIAYSGKTYKHDEFISKIAPLFKENSNDTDMENLYQTSKQQVHLLFKDGLNRYEIAYTNLPNGIKILSNKGRDNLEYCKATGKYDS